MSELNAHMTRRAVAAAAIILVGALSFAAVLTHGGDGHASPGHGGMAGPATSEQKAAAAKLLDEVKRATTRFADVEAALTDGYRQTTPYRFRGR